MIRLIDRNALLKQIDEMPTMPTLVDVLELIREAPEIKPPYGYKPMGDGWWQYHGLPDSIERVIYCQDCEYYNGHECYCDNDHYARDWGYCYMAARSYVTDESD